MLTLKLKSSVLLLQYQKGFTKFIMIKFWQPQQPVFINKTPLCSSLLVFVSNKQHINNKETRKEIHIHYKKEKVWRQEQVFFSSLQHKLFLSYVCLLWDMVRKISALPFLQSYQFTVLIKVWQIGPIVQNKIYYLI